MPRKLVYVPTDLYEMVKTQGLPVSELLQEAVSREARRKNLLAASERYTAELAALVGEPGRRVRARAVAAAQRIAGRMPG